MVKLLSTGWLTFWMVSGTVFEMTGRHRLHSFKLCPVLAGAPALVLTLQEHNHGGGQWTLYTYSGRFWDSSQIFAFPGSIKQDVGRRLWLQGMPVES